MTLTIKQEKFCQKYIELGNASEAYKQSYNAENMQPNTIYVKASNLLSQDKIKVRVEELKAKLEDDMVVTIKTLTEELEEARQLAKLKEQAAPMVSASMGKAKLYGIGVDKHEITGKDGGAIEVKDLSAEEAYRILLDADT